MSDCVCVVVVVVVRGVTSKRWASLFLVASCLSEPWCSRSLVLQGLFSDIARCPLNLFQPLPATSVVSQHTQGSVGTATFNLGANSRKSHLRFPTYLFPKGVIVFLSKRFSYGYNLAMYESFVEYLKQFKGLIVDPP